MADAAIGANIAKNAVDNN
ncbi:VENN motif pre-toxin domain-containing protein [Xanthomonas axonopodis]|nr:VENN motif pre-toxin domain-containing protein [Xanthomonas axonopodis]